MGHSRQSCCWHSDHHTTYKRYTVRHPIPNCAAYHKTIASVLVWKRKKMFPMLNFHTSNVLSIATVASRMLNSLRLPCSMRSWQLLHQQLASAPCDTVSGVVGMKSHLEGEPHKVHHLRIHKDYRQLTKDLCDNLLVCRTVS